MEWPICWIYHHCHSWPLKQPFQITAFLHIWLLPMTTRPIKAFQCIRSLLVTLVTKNNVTKNVLYHYVDVTMGPHQCLLNRLFGCRSRKTSKFRVIGLCAGNSPGTSELPTQMASNAENVSIWWRHHVNVCMCARVICWWYLYNINTKAFYSDPTLYLKISHSTMGWYVDIHNSV